MSNGRITIDFETKSEADLPQVGAWNYSLHPSTEVICMCYRIRLPDGTRGEVQEWVPGSPCPADLDIAIRQDYEVEAHNYSFELAIWNNVCKRRYEGFPIIVPHQWRCSMAVAAYYAMPQALESLCRAIGFEGKDKAGSMLISKYSKLNLKTAKRDIPPDDLRKFIDYCKTDVEREEAVSDYLGDLPDRELAVFQLDQKINMRGLFLDQEGIAAASKVVDQRSDQLVDRFREITGYNPTQGAKLIPWFAERGVVLDNMQAGYLQDQLDAGAIPAGECREAAMIRLEVNKASTKKLDAMARNCSTNGRALWQSRYHGAATGRWTGAGFQPLNLVRSWEDVDPDQLVRDVKHGDPAFLDLLYGDAMEAVSKAGRHWIMAQPGNRILAADFVSIEAVILACLAGEQWKVDAFREGKKIYELMGDKIHGLPEGTVTKKTHPDMRQDGKTCLGAGTQVLTNRGYVAITDVTRTDKLWDGVTWITHDGLLQQGQKETIEWLGVTITPDHLSLCDGIWFSAEMASSSDLLTRLALASGMENLPSWAIRSAPKVASSLYGCGVPVAQASISSVRATYGTGAPPDALRVQEGSLENGVSSSGGLRTSAQMTRTAVAFSIASRLASHAASLMGIRTTGRVGSPSTSLGRAEQKAAAPSSPTSWPCQGGMSRSLRSTARKWTAIMSRAISGSSPGPSTQPTSDKSASSSNASQSLKPVYDLANAGPRQRFTILTDAGPVIVHNCELAFGYQGALGAWLKFDKSGRHTDERIVEICKAWRAQHPMIVAFWRGLEDAAIAAVAAPTAGPQKDGWIKPDYGIGQSGMRYYETEYRKAETKTQYRDIGFEIVDEWLSMILPNGKRIWYREPELRMGMPTWHKPDTDEVCAKGECRCKPMAKLTYMAQKEGQWKRVTTYGGKLAENATQATSREFLIPSIQAAEKAKYHTILTVYDEIVAEVPHGHGSLEEFCAILKDAPGREWAKGYPIGVDGWEGGRYKK